MFIDIKSNSDLILYHYVNQLLDKFAHFYNNQTKIIIKFSSTTSIFKLG